MNLEETIQYLGKCRWCNFKEDIKQGRINDISLETLPYDNGNKLFVIGEVRLKDDVVRYFSMPLAKKKECPDTMDTLQINGEVYTDALIEPDFWQTFMKLMNDNNGIVHFPNGWLLKRHDIFNADAIDGCAEQPSQALGVEQSNTTLNVGDGRLAFKLERMLEFSQEVNSEIEMNEKLMREKCEVMPKSFGGFIWQMPDGRTASSGIVQEFVHNKGDMWNYLLNYLQQKMQEGYLQQRKLTAENCPEFMSLINTLSRKTQEMGECFTRADLNPHFTPEPVSETFIRNYEKQFQVLRYQAKRNIENNINRLPYDTGIQAKEILSNWDTSTLNFVQSRLDKIRKSADKGMLNRVHGDFHLGQVMVTPDNDLRFIDFAGEPGLSMVERQQKHLSVRDVAGMYRSIKGYLSAVAVENFAQQVTDDISMQHRKHWGQEAIKPLIDAAAQTFLGSKTLQNDNWLALEVLRKNFYEIDYELNNRPEMAYVPINGLIDLLGTGGHMAVNEKIKFLKQKSL
ncbi:MAG: hypothetical protein IJ864_03855 [Alphaproteobacteria bacterium]|nr:hypothetical protein [Alphaproteobacteria bacterium]